MATVAFPKTINSLGNANFDIMFLLEMIEFVPVNTVLENIVYANIPVDTYAQ